MIYLSHEKQSSRASRVLPLYCGAPDAALHKILQSRIPRRSMVVL